MLATAWSPVPVPIPLHPIPLQTVRPDRLVDRRLQRVGVLRQPREDAEDVEDGDIRVHLFRPMVMSLAEVTAPQLTDDGEQSRGVVVRKTEQVHAGDVFNPAGPSTVLMMSTFIPRTSVTVSGASGET